MFPRTIDAPQHHEAVAALGEILKNIWRALKGFGHAILQTLSTIVK